MIKNVCTTGFKALSDSNPKSHPHDYTRPPITTGVQDEVRLNKLLRKQWQVNMGLAVKAKVNRLQRSTCELGPVEYDIKTPLWTMTNG